MQNVRMKLLDDIDASDIIKDSENNFITHECTIFKARSQDNISLFDIKTNKQLFSAEVIYYKKQWLFISISESSRAYHIQQCPHCFMVLEKPEAENNTLEKHHD